VRSGFATVLGGLRESLHHLKTWVSLASLQAAGLGSMDSQDVGEVLLRELPLEPKSAEVPPEPHLENAAQRLIGPSRYAKVYRLIRSTGCA